MPIKVTDKGTGSVVKFPDGTSEDVIRGAMDANFGQRPALTEPSPMKAFLDDHADEKTARQMEHALLGKIAFDHNAADLLRHPGSYELAVSHDSRAVQTRDETERFYGAVSALGAHHQYTSAQIPETSAEELLPYAELFAKEGLIEQHELEAFKADPKSMQLFQAPAPMHFYDKTWVERVKEAPQSIAGGVNNTLGGFFHGVEWLGGKSRVGFGARAVAEWFESNAEIATRGVRTDFFTDLWGAVGSMAAFVVPSAGVGGLGRLAGLSRGTALTLEVTVASATEALTEAGGSYNKVLQETKTSLNPQGDIFKARKAARISFGANLPLLLITNRLGLYKARHTALVGGPALGAKKVGKEFAEGFTGEAIQEAGQAVIGQVAEERPFDLGELLYNGFIGGLVGGGTSALMGAAVKKIDAIPEMPPATEKLYLDTVQAGIDEGLNAEKAHILGSQAIAQTKEGQEYINTVMEAQEAVTEAEAKMGQDIPLPAQDTIQSVVERLRAGELTEEDALDEILSLERQTGADFSLGAEEAQRIDEARTAVSQAREAGDTRPILEILTPEHREALETAQKRFSERLAQQRERIDERGLTMSPETPVGDTTIQGLVDLLNQGNTEEVSGIIDSLPTDEAQEVRHNVRTLANIQAEGVAAFSLEETTQPTPSIKSDLEAQFPQAEVVDWIVPPGAQGQEAFAVIMPEGNVIIVTTGAELTAADFTPEEIENVRFAHADRIAGELTDEEVSALLASQVKGYHKAIGADSLIVLTKKATDQTLLHETWHLIRQYGILTENELAVLDKAFPAENANRSEELQADGYAAWTPEGKDATEQDSIFRKIYNFFRGVVDSLFKGGLEGRNVDEIFELAKSGRIFERKARRDAVAKQFSLGRNGQVLWDKWFASKGILRLSDWVKAEVFGEGGAVEDNGQLKFISRDPKGKGTLFGFDQFAQMAFDEGLIEDAEIGTLLEAIRDSQHMPPKTLEERVEEELEADLAASGVEFVEEDFLGIQEATGQRVTPASGQLFGAAEFKGTLQGKIPGGSEAITELERATQEAQGREIEAQEKAATEDLFEGKGTTLRSDVSEDTALRENIRNILRSAEASGEVNIKSEAARIRELFKEARARQDQKAETKKTQKRLAKIRKSKKKNISVDYQKRINDLIDTVDLKGRPTEKTLNSLSSLKEWLDTHKDKMNIPDARLAQLSRLGKMSLQEMTLEDVKEIDDTIKTLVHVGKLKRRLELKYDKVRLAEKTKEFTDIVVNIDGDFNAADPTPGQIFKRGAKSAYLVTMHTPRVADIQDGFNDYNGPHAETIKDFSNRETNANMTSQSIARSALEEIIKKTGIEELTEEQQLNIMINIRLQEKAHGAVKTLMERNGLTEVPAISAEEQEFINIIQKHTTMFTDQIAATVEEIDNQIFPLMDNHILNLKYEKDVSISDAPLDAILPGNHRTTKTPQGFKIERVEGVKKTPRTDILVIFEEQINAQQWYLNMQPAIEESRQIFLSKDYAEAAGEMNTEWWSEQLDIIARRGWSATAGGSKAINAALRQGRINLNKAVLGYKASSILMQPFAIFDAMAYTSSRWGVQTSTEMAAEFTKAWLKPNYAKSIIEGSPALQLRQAGELAVEEVLDKTKGSGFLDKFVRGGFAALRESDVRTAAGVRQGILNILKKNGVENAEVEADFLMNMVSGNSDVVLRPQILSKGEGARLWFTFQSFFLNRWGLVAHDLITAGVVKGDIARKLNTLLGMAILMAGGLGEDEAREIVFETITGRDLPEDTMMKQLLLYVPSMIPLLGPMVEAAFSGRKSEPPIIRTAQQAIEGVSRVVKGKDLESKARGFVKGVEAGATIRFGVPGTAQFFDFVERVLFEDDKKSKRRTR